MAIQTKVLPFTVKTTNGKSSTLTTETGTTNDGRIVAISKATDDGLGNFLTGLGNVNYVGKQLNIKVVDFTRSTESYKSDHQDAAEFERTVADGEGSSSSDSSKGGSYGTASVGEQMLASSSVMVRYRTGAGVPLAKTMGYVMPAVSLDLCPLTTDRIVAGSVMFRWMATTYVDFEGVIYRGRTDTQPGTISGYIDYAGGAVLMTDYVVGGTGPADFQLISLWTQKGQWTTASLFFNTEAAPLRAGAGSFVLTVNDTKGNLLRADIDNQGNITGTHMRGKVVFARGSVALQFGDFILAAELTDADKAEWWYSAGDVGAVEAGKIWRPWPVDPTTLRYNAVTYVYLPVDVNLMGLDPAALPSDGRVPFVREGDSGWIGTEYGGTAFVPNVGMTYELGHERMSHIHVLGEDGAEIFTGFEADLDAGTVKFTDLTGYPAQVRVIGRVGVYLKVSKVLINGEVHFTTPIGYAFPAGAVFSSALRQGDRYARVTRVYTQKSWDGVTWYDGLDPAIGPAAAKYDHDAYAIEVTNLGAISQRWALKFKDSQNYELYGQKSGLVGTFSINTDSKPLNRAAGAPYMHIKELGFGGGGFIPNNTVFIDTVGAEAQIACVRCVMPGTPAGIEDNSIFVQYGDVGRAPESTL